MKTLQDRVVIFTGASSGIGRATACEFARRGAKVVLAARRTDALVAVQQEIEHQGGTAIAIPTDVADSQQLLALERSAIAAYGQIDVLVNNAGFLPGILVEQSIEQIQQVVQVNLLGAMLMTQAVLPGMIERRHGVIISVGSLTSWVAFDPLYSATKFGLRGFSLGLRRQLQGTGVTTCVVFPGFIQTDLTAHFKWKWKMPEPEVVAQAIVQLALYPRRELFVPRYYAVSPWFEQQMPWLVDRFVAWFYRNHSF